MTTNTITEPINSETSAPPRVRRMGKVKLLFIMVLPIIIILGLGFALLQANRAQLQAGPAPDFTLTTYDNQTFNLADYKGQVVLINFWASWCGPCRYEAPELNKIYDKYKGQGLVMVGVGWLDSPEKARAYLAEFGVAYPTGHDAASKIARQYGIKGVPETFIIDKQGNIVKFIEGEVALSWLGPYLETLLNQTPTTGNNPS